LIVLKIFGGIVGLIVAFFALSSVMEAGAKKKAAERLEKAKKLFSQGDQVKCLEVLEEAFFVPSSGKYTPETARVALDVLDFFIKVLSDMGVSKTEPVEKLKLELQKIKTEPAEVADSLTEPVEELFKSMNVGQTRDLNKMMEMARNGEIEVRESRDDNDFTSNIDGAASDVVNNVGKLLIRGKAKEAIGILTPLIPSEDDNATATFLEQRAACYCMEKEFDKSLEDYQAILKLFPRHTRTFENIEDVRKNMK